MTVFILANSHFRKKKKGGGREFPIIKRCLSTFSPLWPMTVCGRGGGRSSCRLAGFLANARIVLWEKKGVGGESGARRLCDNKSLRLHLNARDFSQHKSKMSAGRVGGCVAAARMGFRGKILKYLFFFFQKKNSPFIPPSGSRPTN